jgi:hypothetical protein
MLHIRLSLSLFVLAACSPRESSAPSPSPVDPGCDDCSSTPPDDDLDGDGHLSADDCDDHDATQGGPELWGDGLDNDCDDAIDCEDSDLDVISAWEGNLTPDDLPGFCEGYCARSVTGHLSVYDTDLVDLTELSCLTSVAGGITLWRNTELTSLHGLERLTSVGEDVFVSYNSSLASLSQLQGLTEVPGALRVEGSPSLTSLQGLENVTSVGALSIELCDGLTSLEGLGDLAEVEGLFRIYDNPNLASLQGLSILHEIGGDLELVSNSSLASLDGLDELAEVGGDLIVQGSALGSLDGLHSLVAVQGTLSIQRNELLTSLDGLKNLANIERDLQIGGLLGEGNPSLVDTRALHSLWVVGRDVLIAGNVSLTDASAHILVDEIDKIGGTITVSGNE